MGIRSWAEEWFVENDVTGRVIRQQNGLDWERFEVGSHKMFAVMKVYDN